MTIRFFQPFFLGGLVLLWFEISTSPIYIFLFVLSVATIFGYILYSYFKARSDSKHAHQVTVAIVAEPTQVDGKQQYLAKPGLLHQESKPIERRAVSVPPLVVESSQKKVPQLGSSVNEESKSSRSSSSAAVSSFQPLRPLHHLTSTNTKVEVDVSVISSSSFPRTNAKSKESSCDSYNPTSNLTRAAVADIVRPLSLDEADEADEVSSVASSSFDHSSESDLSGSLSAVSLDDDDNEA
jgi:hypothetical protein